jgi:cytochrome P450
MGADDERGGAMTIPQHGPVGPRRTGWWRVATLRRARTGNPDARLLVDPALQADPYPQYEKLRTSAPFVAGALSRLSVHHDTCTEVLRSDDFGVLAQDVPVPAPLRLALRLAGPPPHIGPLDPPSMLAVNPPTHIRYRRLVTRAFTARAVAALRERTEAIAHELLDDLERAGRDGDGRVDLVAGYASLLPVTVICEVLGIPASMRGQFLAWGDGAAASLDMGLDRARFEEVEHNLAAIEGWMRGHLRRLRREPGGDLLSTLVTMTDDDGSGLTETELMATASLVLGAGFETTVNLIANGTALLLAHPEQRRSLAERPQLWPNAVEEVLRVESPVQRTARRAGGRRASVGSTSPTASWWSPCWPRPTATRGSSTTRTPSTWPGPTPRTTSASPAACTTAWERRWRGWRGRWPCGRCSSGSGGWRPRGRRSGGGPGCCAATRRCRWRWARGRRSRGEPGGPGQPRPMNGIVVAVIVRNCTLASRGSPAM